MYWLAYLIPMFIASDVPIMQIASNMLLAILAAWSHKDTRKNGKPEQKKDCKVENYFDIPTKYQNGEKKEPNQERERKRERERERERERKRERERERERERQRERERERERERDRQTDRERERERERERVRVRESERRTVQLVLCHHLMHVKEVWSVTSISGAQFHCTKL